MDILKMERVMFLSIVNMKLRDEFEDIKDLCNYYDLNFFEFENKLKEFSLKYVKDINQLKKMF